jgi:hypothetical protein
VHGRVDQTRAHVSGTEDLTGMHSSNASSQPAGPELSVARGFALMLETACEDFEVLQRLIRQETRMLFATGGREDFRAVHSTEMALAKSFVFHVQRARRICEHGAGALAVDRTERKRFLSATAKVLGVRDVNEHGYEPGADSKPSIHRHGENFAALDETSMIVLGDQNILMGPINLYDIYLPTDRLRTLAGFASLPRSRPGFA